MRGACIRLPCSRKSCGTFDNRTLGVWNCYSIARSACGMVSHRQAGRLSLFATGTPRVRFVSTSTLAVPVRWAFAREAFRHLCTWRWACVFVLHYHAVVVDSFAISCWACESVCQVHARRVHLLARRRQGMWLRSPFAREARGLVRHDHIGSVCVCVCVCVFRRRGQGQRVGSAASSARGVRIRAQVSSEAYGSICR